MPPRTLWYGIAIVICIFFSPAILQGCDGLLSAEDSDIIDNAAIPNEKSLHQFLLNKAIKAMLPAN